jgi:radical SAM superfamily enzyme YgiQ (UPF0313 family)
MLARIAGRPAGFAAPALRIGRPDAGLAAARATCSTLRVYFIKPSRYDDDGSVLAYRWGVIPNNTLIALAGLNVAYGAAHPELDVQTVLWDELVDGVVTAGVVASIVDRGLRDDADLIVGLAGVQTNQYPRARDLALEFRRRGATVLIGGFHVSSHAPSRAFLESHGVTTVSGEADVTWPALLDDHRRGALRASYRVEDGLRVRSGTGTLTVPAIDAAPLPAIDDRYVRRFFNPTFSTLDTSRGCPFTCSYCSVMNVMGRTMRSRPPDAVVDWVRDAYDRHGIRNLLVVDDDFYRSPRWEPILAGIADLRRSRPDLAFIMQVDVEAAAHDAAPAGHGAPERSRRFVALAAAAGCFEVFIGFESFDPANLEGARKFHNEERVDRRRAAAAPAAAEERVLERYRRVVANWHAAGVGVHSGYIIGLPHDRPGCGRAAARALADIGVDIASFFVHTPFPGTEDYDAALAAGRITDHDFNAYDSTHVVHAHPHLSAVELLHEYRDAYRYFFTWRRLAWSLATFHRMPGLTNATRAGMLSQQLYFTYATRRGCHPMMGGIWRCGAPGVRRTAVTDDEAARRFATGPSPVTVRGVLHNHG